MVSYEKDRQVVPSYHNRPLYVTASICNVELTREMVDLDSSLHIIPLSTYEATGTPSDRIVKQPI